MLAVTDILKDPGPSQSQNFVSSTTKALFVDSNGQPLHIFVEASSILGRPRLIRNLRVCISGPLSVFKRCTDGFL